MQLIFREICTDLLFLPPATKLGQGYVFTRVCDSRITGVCLSNAGIPPSKETPLARRPSWQGDPPPQCILGDMVNEQAVCILLECNSFYDLQCKQIIYLFSDI